jgi:hypothetical protein
MDIDISPEWRELVQKCFPGLVEGVSFEFTSKVDYNYNCLSWALSIDYVPLENYKGAFWTWKDIPDNTADGWVKVCEIHGFTLIENADTAFVPGYEKIAIFEQSNEEGDEDGDGRLHAARQDRNGKWKSKLGDMGPDIDHNELAPLESVYGKVVRVLQKRGLDWD